MKYQDARKIQYRRSSMYAAYLVGPGGERELLGHTARKSGRGLLALLARDSAQARIKLFPNSEAITLEKSAASLTLSNGWRIEFGGTMIQDSDRE